MLKEVVERKDIATGDDGIYYTLGGVKYPLSPDTVVSMNLWGLTPSYIRECNERFSRFLSENVEENPLKCEYYLPTVITELLMEGKADVKVLKSTDRWYGVTYREDKKDVEIAFASLISEGKYPRGF